jgi:hypothetical protein
MAIVIMTTSLPINIARAGMIPTKQVIETTVTPDSHGRADPTPAADSARERVLALLAGDDLLNEMAALGIDPAEARARVAAMTDHELTMVAGRLDELPAGEGVGGILVILFVVFGMVVLLDALGLLNILPFVCGPGECGPQAGLFPQASAYPEPAAGPVDDYLYQEERAPAYRREGERSDPYARRRQPRYETEQYYEPGPVPSARNYYEERFGTQRQIR